MRETMLLRPASASAMSTPDALCWFAAMLLPAKPCRLKKKARPPRLIAGWGGRLNRRVLLRVLLHEGMDRRVRDVGVSRGIIEVGDLDVAAGLAVIADEPLGLVAGEVRIGVVGVMGGVRPGLQPA